MPGVFFSDATQQPLRGLGDIGEGVGLGTVARSSAKNRTTGQVARLPQSLSRLKPPQHIPAFFHFALQLCYKAKPLRPLEKAGQRSSHLSGSMRPGLAFICTPGHRDLQQGIMLIDIRSRVNSFMSSISSQPNFVNCVAHPAREVTSWS